MALISIENMEFYAYHGCFKEEEIIGTRFKVDFFYEVNTDKAQKSDNINDTISYLEVYKLIKKEVQIRSNLIENLADRILNTIFNNYSIITKAKVKIYKLNPSLGGKIGAVTIVIERDRSN